MNLFICLSQSLQVDKHVLIVLPKLLYLLFFERTVVFESGNLLVLLLDYDRHLLCLSFKIYQCLLCLFKFLSNCILHRVVPFVDLSQLHLILYFLLLKLVLELLFALLRLVQRDLLLQRIILHLLNLEQQVLDLAIELLENALVLLDHASHLHVVLFVLMLLQVVDEGLGRCACLLEELIDATVIREQVIFAKARLEVRLERRSSHLRLQHLVLL